MNEPHDVWLRGFAAALGALQRMHHRDSMVRDIMAGDGVTLADLERAGVAEFDLAPIRKAIS